MCLLTDLDANDLRAFAAAALAARANHKHVVEHRRRRIDAAADVDAVEHDTTNDDLTWFDTEREGYFIFIELDNQLNLCNMSANNDDYSFGTILDIKSEKTEETDDTYESATYKFRWKYYNTYDDETGYANINFEKIYKPQGTIFKLTMILPNLDVYIYKGYMEGTLDFDKLK